MFHNIIDSYSQYETTCTLIDKQIIVNNEGFKFNNYAINLVVKYNNNYKIKRANECSSKESCVALLNTYPAIDKNLDCYYDHHSNNVQFKPYKHYILYLLLSLIFLAVNVGLGIGFIASITTKSKLEDKIYHQDLKKKFIKV